MTESAELTIGCVISSICLGVEEKGGVEGKGRVDEQRQQQAERTIRRTTQSTPLAISRLPRLI